MARCHVVGPGSKRKQQRTQGAPEKLLKETLTSILVQYLKSLSNLRVDSVVGVYEKLVGLIGRKRSNVPHIL